MSPESTPGGLDDPGRLVDAQPDISGAERDDQLVAQWPLAVDDGVVDDVGHPHVALEPSGDRRVVAGLARAQECDVGDEIGEHDLFDAGLAERWEHALDVAEEHAVRANDEHTLVVEREPVGVDEVGGAVERDDRLAGAGAPLHDEYAVLGRADDLVLLTLDRGDDVAERAGSSPFERGEQRRIAPQPVRAVG